MTRTAQDRLDAIRRIRKQSEQFDTNGNEEVASLLANIETACDLIEVEIRKEPTP